MKLFNPNPARLWRIRFKDRPQVFVWAVQALKILCVLWQDVQHGTLTLRAMSLVYTTLLSLVPLLAVSFSVLKAFGAHNNLEQTMLGLLEPLGREKSVEITAYILTFVSNIKVGVLGAVGFILLFYVVIALLQKVEAAFNDIWHVAQGRSLVRRFSDYLSVILIGPVMVMASLAVSGMLLDHQITHSILAVEPFGLLFSAVTRLTPLLLATLAFMLIYIIVPNTRVRLAPALIGGFCAAAAWKFTGFIFTQFVVESSSYEAIYSGFAALILFMLWLSFSWTILLMGAGIAFYIQQPEYVRWGKTDATGARETLHTQRTFALRMMVEIARNFAAEKGGASLTTLTQKLHIPAPTIRPWLARFVHAGLVVETKENIGGKTAEKWLPARPLDKITLLEVWTVIHGTKTSLPFEDKPLATFLKKHQAVEEKLLKGTTLKDFIS